MPKIAVAGVKGSTGREFLNLLNESGIPADDVFALEVKAPLGTLVSYGEDDELDVSALDTFDFKKADIAIFATTKEQGKRFIKKGMPGDCPFGGNVRRQFGSAGYSRIDRRTVETGERADNRRAAAGYRRAVVGGVSDFAAAGGNHQRTQA